MLKAFAGRLIIIFQAVIFLGQNFRFSGFCCWRESKCRFKLGKGMLHAPPRALRARGKNPWWLKELKGRPREPKECTRPPKESSIWHGNLRVGSKVDYEVIIIAKSGHQGIKYLYYFKENPPINLSFPGCFRGVCGRDPHEDPFERKSGHKESKSHKWGILL